MKSKLIHGNRNSIICNTKGGFLRHNGEKLVYITRSASDGPRTDAIKPDGKHRISGSGNLH